MYSSIRKVGSNNLSSMAARQKHQIKLNEKVKGLILSTRSRNPSEVTDIKEAITLAIKLVNSQVNKKEESDGSSLQNILDKLSENAKNDFNEFFNNSETQDGLKVLSFNPALHARFSYFHGMRKMDLDDAEQDSEPTSSAKMRAILNEPINRSIQELLEFVAKC